MVINANLIIAGDQLGWNDLTYAAAAVAWGQAIEVPEITLYCTALLSPSNWESEATGDHAAITSTPGAAMSG